jgi:thymidylate kinase
VFFSLFLQGSSVTIVSFSGIDGAGKSTQIGALESWLRRSGLSTKLVTFWDDVAVLSSSREFASHRVFKGDQGVGSPENPLSRRDKNVTSRWVAAARIFIYFADAINLYLKVRKLRKSNADVVIFDRYIYDELANLPLNHRLARSFMRLVLKFVPKPDVGYVIDAEPTEALARKPEYPLEFVRRNRDSYLRLAKLAGNITVIPSHSIEMVQAEIREELLQKLPAHELKLSNLLLSL